MIWEHTVFFVQYQPTSKALQLALGGRASFPSISTTVRQSQPEFDVAAAGWEDHVTHHCLRGLKMLMLPAPVCKEDKYPQWSKGPAASILEWECFFSLVPPSHRAIGIEGSKYSEALP